MDACKIKKSLKATNSIRQSYLCIEIGKDVFEDI